MHRTAAPLLVAAALLAVSAPSASADPVAEVGPGSVGPGGSVTVSVTCDPLGTTAPDTLDAVSDAFADGTVRLDRVPGADDGESGPAYRGTALIAAEADLGTAPDAAGPEPAWTVDGTCPAPPGGQDGAWSTALDVPRGDTAAADCATAYTATCENTGRPCAEREPGAYDTPCAPSHAAPVAPAASVAPVAPVAPVEHGVRAGDGGSLGDSVPALVVGGLLIAGAAGAAAHRLWRRRPTTRA